MKDSLPGSVVFITGASSGIGEASARAFAREGCDLALAARRYEKLEVLAESLQRAHPGIRALPLRLDVSDHGQVRECVLACHDAFKRVDILFNNAGFGRFDWIERLDPLSDVKRQIDVNLTGMMWLAQEVLPGMQARRKGHIINMASTAGFVATPTYSVYAASKFAIRGFSDALRREVSAWGIHVSAVYPGGARTEFDEHTGASRRTGIATPSWLRLSPETIAEAVVDCARRPKREVILPAFYKPVIWLHSLAPWLFDWGMKRFFVVPERSDDLTSMEGQ